MGVVINDIFCSSSLQEGQFFIRHLVSNVRLGMRSEI